MHCALCLTRRNVWCRSGVPWIWLRFGILFARLVVTRRSRSILRLAKVMFRVKRILNLLVGRRARVITIGTRSRRCGLRRLYSPCVSSSGFLRVMSCVRRVRAIRLTWVQMKLVILGVRSRSLALNLFYLLDCRILNCLPLRLNVSRCRPCRMET